MPRPQFTLRALLVAMLVVAAFFGGMAVQKQLDDPKMVRAPLGGDPYSDSGGLYVETITLRDGSEFHRVVDPTVDEGP